MKLQIRKTKNSHSNAESNKIIVSFTWRWCARMWIECETRLSFPLFPCLLLVHALPAFKVLRKMVTVDSFAAFALWYASVYVYKLMCCCCFSLENNTCIRTSTIYILLERHLFLSTFLFVSLHMFVCIYYALPFRSLSFPFLPFTILHHRRYRRRRHFLLVFCVSWLLRLFGVLPLSYSILRHLVHIQFLCISICVNVNVLWLFGCLFGFLSACLC